MMPDLRLVVFDVDGTLVDSQAHILGAMTRAFAAVDLPMPPRERALSIVGLSLPQAFARLCPTQPEPTIEAMIQAYRNAFADMRSDAAHQMSPLYPGAVDAMDAIGARGNWLMGVATGKSARGLRAIIEAHGLGARFVTRQVADHHPSKPHPAMLAAALDEAGVTPSAAVMVGDTAFDIEMARALGVFAIGVAWGYHPTQALHDAGADVVLSSFDQLVPVLNKRWR